MWRRRLVIYSAAHTLALWAMGLGFAMSALLLGSPLAAALVGAVVVALYVGIIANAEARRVRAEAKGVLFRKRLHKVADTRPRADSSAGDVPDAEAT
jgi:hypothetical protein